MELNSFYPFKNPSCLQWPPPHYDGFQAAWQKVPMENSSFRNELLVRGNWKMLTQESCGCLISLGFWPLWLWQKTPLVLCLPLIVFRNVEWQACLSNFWARWNWSFQLKKWRKSPKLLLQNRGLFCWQFASFAPVIMAHNSRASIARLLMSLKRQLWQMNDLQTRVSFLVLSIGSIFWS